MRVLQNMWLFIDEISMASARLLADAASKMLEASRRHAGRGRARRRRHASAAQRVQGGAERWRQAACAAEWRADVPTERISAARECTSP
eukprot:2130664-Pyramimonas_sp.AAC.1